MQRFIPLLALSVMLSVLLISATPVQKSQIYGAWRLSTGKHNGAAAPQSLSKRIQFFYKNNTFESKIETDKGQVRGNGGSFYLLNDSTMVTYHSDLLGKLDPIANTYHFKITKDTMHFYGFYLSHSPQNSSVLIKVYIDEWWVKSEKK